MSDFYVNPGVSSNIITEEITQRKQPELSLIAERLQLCVSRYEGIVIETTSRLRNIKKYEEIPMPNDIGQYLASPKPSEEEAATETLHALIDRIEKLNGFADINLLHLREIV